MNISTNILEIPDKQFMQNVQDFLAKALDVALVCVYKSEWLTEPSNICQFCTGLTKRSQKGFYHCEKCHREWEAEAVKSQKPFICKCHVGLTNFAIPISVCGKYARCIIGGQVLTEPPEEKHFREVAHQLNINETDYIKAMKDLKILSEEKVKDIADMLYILTNSIYGLAYANQNYSVPKNLAVEKWFLQKVQKTNKPLSSREYEVLKLIVQGKSNTEIAKELFISVHTAKSHVSTILEKFDVKDRTQLAVKAVRDGII